MLQRCSSNSTTSFSLLFPMYSTSAGMEDHQPNNLYGSSSSSVVDCTLSLGTPSTRQSSPPSHHRSATTPSSFCWDLITSSKSQQPSANASAGMGGDPLLLARRCANCDTTSTPLWRNGPRGPKSLCNACGIRYKKEERRAAASTANFNDSVGYGTQQQQQQYSWMSSSASWCQNDHHDDMVSTWRLNVVPPHFSVTDRPSLFQYQ